MTNSAIVGSAGLNTHYDGTGNITGKTGVGTYTYPAAGGAQPHAVSSITGTVNSGTGLVTNPTYTYDANGNMIVGGGRALSYTAFNVPNCISSGLTTCAAGGAHTELFTYDSEHRRSQQVAPEGTTTYINAAGVLTEQFVASNGAATWRSYLMAGNQAIGMVVLPVGGTAVTSYFHGDHLGSVGAITSATGTLLEQDSYDPWGKRRNLNGASDPNDALPASLTTRGYTNQETLGDVALVHMNGRVYDPQIGRFTSGDPMISRPYSPQGWNRYAYVENNPLNSTDPTGFDGCPYGADGCMTVYPGNDILLDGCGCGDDGGGGGGSGEPADFGLTASIKGIANQFSGRTMTGSHIPGVQTFASCTGNCTSAAQQFAQAVLNSGVLANAPPQLIDAFQALARGQTTLANLGAVMDASGEQEPQSAQTGGYTQTGYDTWDNATGTGEVVVVASAIPGPPNNLPGGPYTPSGAGQAPGTYFGPSQASGPRPILRWVPPEAEGGPPGSKGYWKVQSPGQSGWDRYDQSGEPMTPDEAHPNPIPTLPSTIDPELPLPILITPPGFKCFVIPGSCQGASLDHRQEDDVSHSQLASRRDGIRLVDDHRFEYGFAENITSHHFLSNG